jgi:adenylosuccinate lyase
MKMTSFVQYQSPFSWRYGSLEMSRIWSEENKRLLWRKLWVALAEAQVEWKLVSHDQVKDLKANMTKVDVAQALQMEEKIRHDVMAEIKVFASQCSRGGGIIHLGATSMDIKDNAEVLQTIESLDLLLTKLLNLLHILAEKLDEFASVPVMAFTHLQPAEPTTLGYRLASFAQDLVNDYRSLIRVRQEIKGKGFKGAVGNAASYVMLCGNLEEQQRFEDLIGKALGLSFFDVATQTYSRKQDYLVISTLAGLAATASKFAFDLRLLQSEVIGELGEPFAKEQVGSSAMPFKRNPIEAEKINSLARAVSVAPLTAWNNYANSLLERTLDDSANRRTLFPETFLALDEILISLAAIFKGLRVNQANIKRNLNMFGPFAAIERVLMAGVKNGADRQELHELLRQKSMDAWKSIQSGKANPLFELIQKDERIIRWVPLSELKSIFTIEGYTGIAESRTHTLARQIRDIKVS